MQRLCRIEEFQAYFRGDVEPESVVERVEREIADYQQYRPARLGTARSVERVRAELAALSRA
jgi:hypothetical protein